MTKAEAVRQLKEQTAPNGQAASIEAISMAISALQKEKEPAPSANDASSNENLSKKNDSTEKAKCQEHITVPEELSKDLFKLMIKLVQDMITSCVRHGICGPKLVSRAVYAAIMASLEILFEHEEDKQ